MRDSHSIWLGVREHLLGTGCQGFGRAREGPPRIICTLGWRVSDHRAIASSLGEVLKSVHEMETRDGQILNHLALLDSHSVWGNINLGVAQDWRQVPSPLLVSPGCQPTC